MSWMLAPPVTEAEWEGLAANVMLDLLPPLYPRFYNHSRPPGPTARQEAACCHYRLLTAALCRLAREWARHIEPTAPGFGLVAGSLADVLAGPAPGEATDWNTAAVAALSEADADPAPTGIPTDCFRDLVDPAPLQGLAALVAVVEDELSDDGHPRRIRAAWDFRQAAAAAVREAVGYPWRPPVRAEWRTATVLAMARGVWADRAFERLPFLADAVEDAGCDHAGLLAHLRGPNTHTHGCWAVTDVLLPPVPGGTA